MTTEELLKAIRAEIKRRAEDLNNRGFDMVANELKEVVAYLDTLQEQPVMDWIEDRKKECPFRKTLGTNLYGCERYVDAVGACDGKCSWVVDYPKLKEIEDRKVKPSKDLDVAAKEYAILPMDVGEGLFCYDNKKRNAFIAGAEWMAKRMPMPEDTVIFQKGVAEGKRLMMEDAVENEVFDFSSSSRERHPRISIPLDNNKYQHGDKVKVIIVKEDEQ